MPYSYYMTPCAYSRATENKDDLMIQARSTKMLPICLGLYKGSFPSWWLHCNMESLETFGSNIPPEEPTTEEACPW